MTLTKYSKTYKVPKRPYESERLDQELKIAGSYGLANKREIWRVVYVLSRIRRAARNLLMLEEGHHTRLFEGTALLRRLVRMGVLSEGVTTLEDVFGIKVEDFLDRRLQSLVAQRKLAKSIHQARVIIRHGHIGVGKQKINVPSFIVRLDSQKHIDFLTRSTIGGMSGRIGRTKRKKTRSEGDNEEEA